MFFGNKGADFDVSIHTVLSFYEVKRGSNIVLLLEGNNFSLSNNYSFFYPRGHVSAYLPFFELPPPFQALVAGSTAHLGGR